MLASIMIVCEGASSSSLLKRGMYPQQMILLNGGVNAAAHNMGWTCIAHLAVIVTELVKGHMVATHRA